jgi:hypothetical protein
MAASITHLPAKPGERDHNKQQFAVAGVLFEMGSVARSGKRLTEAELSG